MRYWYPMLKMELWMVWTSLSFVQSHLSNTKKTTSTLLCLSILYTAQLRQVDLNSLKVPNRLEHDFGRDTQKRSTGNMAHIGSISIHVHADQTV